MFVCYCDESGYTGEKCVDTSPVFVMAGVLVNLYSLTKTSYEFNSISKFVAQKSGVKFQEIKGRDFYRGQGIWKNCDLDGKARHELLVEVLKWFLETKHKLIISTISATELHRAKREDVKIAVHLSQPYVAGALGLALRLQWKQQNKAKNKGRTLLICDQQRQHEEALAGMLSSPPIYTDGFFGTTVVKDRLNQIIDTSYFVRSHHASFIQIADIVAFIVRRHIEITTFRQAESFKGEGEKLDKWINTFLKPSILAEPADLPKYKTPIIEFYRRVSVPI